MTQSEPTCPKCGQGAKRSRAQWTCGTYIVEHPSGDEIVENVECLRRQRDQLHQKLAAAEQREQAERERAERAEEVSQYAIESRKRHEQRAEQAEADQKKLKRQLGEKQRRNFRLEAELEHIKKANYCKECGYSAWITSVETGERRCAVCEARTQRNDMQSDRDYWRQRCGEIAETSRDEGAGLMYLICSIMLDNGDDPRQEGSAELRRRVKHDLHTFDAAQYTAADDTDEDGYKMASSQPLLDARNKLNHAMLHLSQCNDDEGRNARQPVYAALQYLNIVLNGSSQDTSKETDGLYAKYTVYRNDGRDQPGGDKEGAEYFVLDCTHDPHAIPAIRAYHDSAISSGGGNLCIDFHNKYLVGTKYENVGEPMPQPNERYFSEVSQCNCRPEHDIRAETLQNAIISLDSTVRHDGSVSPQQVWKECIANLKANYRRYRDHGGL